MILDVSQVLLYKNQRVIDSFCHAHPECSVGETQRLFSDLLAWMWLSEQRKKLGKHTFLFGPLLILDELWHTFILHTKDYVAFSLQYFGVYFHHEVEPPGEEHIVQEDELHDFLQDCFNYLGSDWVARRFSDALALNLPSEAGHF